MKRAPYPVTRHYQRYEYVINQGYITDKLVLDVGCGCGAGTYLMSYFSKAVIGIDPSLANKANVTVPVYTFPGRQSHDVDFHPVVWEQIDSEHTRMDVVVAMELIEHLKNPDAFLKKMSIIGEYLFLSTPLAAKTGPTRNPEHIVEYSHKDLLSLVGKYYHILDVKYQTSTLQIVNKARSNGSSLELGHIVQMLWCKRK